jgi:hypothetical protein
LWVKRHGKIGLILRQYREINHSHPTKINQKTPEITRKLITKLELQVYWEFPSWRAAMANEQAVKMMNAPTRSSSRKQDFVVRQIRIDTGISVGTEKPCGKWSGRTKNIKNQAKIPAGRLP